MAGWPPLMSDNCKNEHDDLIQKSTCRNNEVTVAAFFFTSILNLDCNYAVIYKDESLLQISAVQDIQTTRIRL